MAGVGEGLATMTDSKKGTVTGHRYSNERVSRMLGGRNQGGIRYAGRFPAITDVGVIMGTSPDAIYADDSTGSKLLYVSEGLHGYQSMKRGNKVLVWCHCNGTPVHAFRQDGTDSILYLGLHQVTSVGTRIEPDKEGKARAVFVFELARTKDQ